MKSIKNQFYQHVLDVKGTEFANELNEVLSFFDTVSLPHVGKRKSTQKGKKKNKNIGTRDEWKCKTNMYTMDRYKKYEKLEDIFGREAKDGIQLFEVSKPDEPIQEMDEIRQKTGSKYKADVIVEMRSSGKRYYPSMKSLKGGKPSILNHTPRSAQIFQKGGKLHRILPRIDALMKKYHEYRRAPGGTEEVVLNKLHEFLDNVDINTLIEVIRVFMFEDTGTGRSKCPADSLLLINENHTYSFRILDTVEKQSAYIRNNLSKFDIALVSRKGLPKDIKTKRVAEMTCTTEKNYRMKFQQMKPWIFWTNKKTRSNPEGQTIMKAALHIRILLK
jgi:hypothetical protein